MQSPFSEGVDRVSVWSLACHLAGQNPIEALPTANTLSKLQQLCTHVLKNRLGVEWASVSPDRPPIFRLDGADAMALIAQIASRPDAVTNWQEARRKLTFIDVRREDWARYDQALADDVTPRAIGAADQFEDVVSLSDALNFIALSIDVPKGRTSTDDAPMWRASEAAKTLYERLHNATGTRPRWMEVHPIIGKPLASNAVADEGMAILLHAAGWYDRETGTRARHTLDCVKAGLDPAVVGPAPRDPNAGQWDYSKCHMREHQIGFVGAELSRLINIGHGVAAGKSASPTQKVVAPATAAHRVSIPPDEMSGSEPGDKFKADRVVRIYHDPEMMVWPDNLLYEIAARLEEIPDDWLIEAGSKEVPVGDGKSLPEPLTSGDLKLIREICGSNPPMRGTRADFNQFEARFNGADSRPEWTLSLKRRPSDELVKARKRYNDVMAQHRAQIGRFVQQGTIRLVDINGIETLDLSKGRLHVDDVKAYLSRCHITYRVPDEDRPDSAEGSEERGHDTVTRVGAQVTPSRAPASPPWDSERVTGNVARSDGLPPELRMGVPNSRESLTAYIAWRARQMNAAGETNGTKISETIAAELREKGYWRERPTEDNPYLSAASVYRLLPKGVTAGRASNGGRSRKIK